LENVNSIDSLSTLNTELEELALNLLLRVTTGLDSIRCPELLQVSKNIFRSLSHVKFSPVVASAISELFSKTTDSQDHQDEENLVKEEVELRTSDCIFEVEEQGEWKIGPHQSEIKIEPEAEEEEMMIFSNNPIQFQDEEEEISREEELSRISSRFNQKKNHSFCILDISGNFGNMIYFPTYSSFSFS